MVQIDKKRSSDGTLHVTIVGKIDERFDGGSVMHDAQGKVVVHLGGIRSISSLGVRAFEHFVQALPGAVLVHVSPAIAQQITMIPNLIGGATVESAKLPFNCPACGAEKNHSVPFRAHANVEHAPKCACGATMELDGLAEQYLPV